MLSAAWALSAKRHAGGDGPQIVLGPMIAVGCCGQFRPGADLELNHLAGGTILAWDMAGLAENTEANACRRSRLWPTPERASAAA